MAIPLPPPIQEEELLKNSVMAEPRGPLQKLTDLIFGRGILDQSNRALTGSLGSFIKFGPGVNAGSPYIFWKGGGTAKNVLDRMVRSTAAKEGQMDIIPPPVQPGALSYMGAGRGVDAGQVRLERLPKKTWWPAYTEEPLSKMGEKDARVLLQQFQDLYGKIPRKIRD